jgi:hypothetical protein
MADGENEFVRAQRSLVHQGTLPDLIGVAAIAAKLKVTPRQIYRWMNLGMPVVSWGPGTIAAYGNLLAAWMVSHPRKSKSKAAA